MNGRGGRPWSRVRKMLAASLPVPCARCGVMVEPGQAWDVDHLDPLASGGALFGGPVAVSHASCNRAHGARLGNARRVTRGQTRRW